MPPITGQSVVIVDANTIVVTVNTSSFGSLAATMQMQTNGNCTVNITQDGNPVLNTSLPNATPTSIENAVQNALLALVTVGGIAQMQVRCHVFSLSPFNMNLLVANIDANTPVIWW